VAEEFLTRVTRSLIVLYPGTIEWQRRTWRVAQARKMGVQCDEDMEDEVGNARNTPPPQTRSRDDIAGVVFKQQVSY
jgi:hypothetical protein